jgi:hypothetical protein
VPGRRSQQAARAMPAWSSSAKIGKHRGSEPPTWQASSLHGICTAHLMCQATISDSILHRTSDKASQHSVECCCVALVVMLHYSGSSLAWGRRRQECASPPVWTHIVRGPLWSMWKCFASAPEIARRTQWPCAHSVQAPLKLDSGEHVAGEAQQGRQSAGGMRIDIKT